MFNFEKLDVWQKSIEFSDNIYKITQRFPKEEKFGIISQLRRTSISIASNIAEGAGRVSEREFKHFLSLAYGSLCECISLLQISLRQKYIREKKYNELYKQCEEIAKMISGLSKSKNSKLSSLVSKLNENDFD